MLKIKFLLLVLLISVELNAYEYEKLWGMKENAFLGSLPSSIDFTAFKPYEKPEYKNRIISFFNVMGGDGVSINVIRIKGIPEKDYCFFNSMLYSVSEDWGFIKTDKADSIIRNIESRYRKKNVDIKDLTTIITFEKDRNKIILYKKTVDKGVLKLRIFFYSNDIFNILLKD